MQPLHTRHVLWIGWVLMGAFSLRSAVAGELDLLSLYGDALVNDPVFQSERLLYEGKQQETQVTRSRLLPNLTFKADAGYNYVDRTSESPFVTESDATATGRMTGHAFGIPSTEDRFVQSEGDEHWDSYSVGVLFTQPVYNRDRSLALTQARLNEEIAATEFELAEDELMMRVVEVYFDVLAAQNNLALALAETTANAEVLGLATERLALGLGTATDVSQARAGHEVALAREINAQKELDAARLQVWQLIGTEIESVRPLRMDSPVSMPEPAHVAYWIERARHLNPDVRIARLREDLARQERDRQKAQRHPTVDFIAGYTYGHDGGSIAGGEVDMHRMDAGFQLQVPLYAGGGVSAAVRLADIRLRAAEEQTETSLRSAVRNAQTAYLSVVSSIREVEAYRQVMAASDDMLNDQLQDFEAGRNTSADVLNAQKDVFQSKRDYLSSRYQYIKQSLTLYLVSGMLEAAAVERLNDWFDPKADGLKPYFPSTLDEGEPRRFEHIVPRG